MPTLLVMRGARVVRSIRVPAGELRIGRWEGNEVVLPSRKVSRIHALLSCRDGAAAIKDARSTNGTFVNGERIDALSVLDGDRLQLGDVELLFCRMDDPAAELAQARPAPVPDASATAPGGLVAAASSRADEVTPSSLAPRPRRAESVGEGVAFSLPMRGRDVSALITYDALASHFGAYAFGEDGGSRAVDAYEANHLAIHVAATYRYQQLPLEPVVLRARDF
ncbi:MULTISPECIES: FHA domain-containing protein [unclassified Variovorax]|uniref:FHA domain-containing protein n=1 Tax=unclassified Variovorax TaxID=663243 RepID=UPI0013922ECB|nr:MULTISPECIES: FHA domain-containing protein [unclassified Variovorax]